MNFVRIEVLKPLGKYQVGQVLKIEADDSGVPKEKYWRSRLKDAFFDGCCKIVKETTKTKSSGKRKS